MHAPSEDEVESRHPISKARRLRNELGDAVKAQQWKRSHNLTQDLIRQIDICLTHEDHHLDGLFRIGTMWYSKAPDKTKDMIDRFNAKLKLEHRRLVK
jgi:hypothetical protein